MKRGTRPDTTESSYHPSQVSTTPSAARSLSASTSSTGLSLIPTSPFQQVQHIADLDNNREGSSGDEIGSRVDEVTGNFLLDRELFQSAGSDSMAFRSSQQFGDVFSMPFGSEGKNRNSSSHGIFATSSDFSHYSTMDESFEENLSNGSMAEVTASDHLSATAPVNSGVLKGGNATDGLPTPSTTTMGSDVAGPTEQSESGSRITMVIDGARPDILAEVMKVLMTSCARVEFRCG